MDNIYIVDESDSVAVGIADKLADASPGGIVRLSEQEFKKLVRQDGIMLAPKENPAGAGLPKGNLI